MGFHPCHDDLEHNNQIHKPVKLKGAKHSGRMSKFFSPHWNAGVVSQALHHMVAHEEESGNLLNTWLRSDSSVERTSSKESASLHSLCLGPKMK